MDENLFHLVRMRLLLTLNIGQRGDGGCDAGTDSGQNLLYRGILRWL